MNALTAVDLGTPPTTPAHQRSRLVGLDGIRGLAALFVVLHHCWLLSFPGYPVNTGPVWTGWLLYGHLAVVVFIVLSGFSLAVSPARREWRLNGLARFAHRRAWRILPPYWAALAYSLIVAWAVVPQPGTPEPTAKSVGVYTLLLQDVFGAPTPNGAFWSIAIEAQLYLVFPLLLVVVRRAGAAAMLAGVTVTVVAIGMFAPDNSLIDLLVRLTPQFAALFAVGLAAAGVLRAAGRVRRFPWHWLALVAAVPPVLLIAVEGSAWTVRNYLWVDLAFGPAVGFLLAAVANGRPTPFVRFLDTRPIRSLGSFSYSLYLIHAPLVVVIHEKIVGPHMARGVPAFLTTLALATPAAVLAARLFAAFFEIPFQRHRSWAPLKAAMRARITRWHDEPRLSEASVSDP